MSSEILLSESLCTNRGFLIALNHFFFDGTRLSRFQVTLRYSMALLPIYIVALGYAEGQL
jgi:hypothetical protein